MKKLLLFALAVCAPVVAQTCAAPTGVQVIGPVNGISGPITGVINLALNYTISGNPQMEQSQMQVQVKAGMLYYNGSPLVCVPANATVVAAYTVNNPAPIVGTTKFQRNWTVPSSGGPYLVSTIECTPGAIGCVTTPNVVIAAGPAGPGGTGNAPYPATVTALTTLTVAASTHLQGTHPVGFCFDASTHSIACDWSTDSSGNLTFSWPGGFTGTVTILGGGTGSTGAQGAQGVPGPTGPAGTIGVFGSAPSTVGIYCPQVTVTAGPTYAYGWASCSGTLSWASLSNGGWAGLSNSQWTGMTN